MKKIKLKEDQVMMLKLSESRKNIKITEQQFASILESINITQERENIIESFGGETEENGNDLYTFAKETIEFLKGLLTNVKTAGITPYWEQVGTSRLEVFNIMKQLPLITIVDNQGVKEVKVLRRNLKRNIKNLYSMIKDKKTIKEDNGSNMNQELDVIYSNNEFVILENGNDLYLFSYEHIPELVDSEIPTNGETVEKYVRANINALSKGVGMSGYDNGVDLVKIDSDLKQNLLRLWGNKPKLMRALSTITNESIKTEEVTSRNNDTFNFYIVDRVSKKIHDGCDTKECAEKKLITLTKPDLKLGIYGIKFLVNNKINPTEDSNWVSSIGETTTAAGSSGSFVGTAIWAKDKGNHRLNKPIAKGWAITKAGKDTEDDIEGIKENYMDDMVSLENFSRELKHLISSYVNKGIKRRDLAKMGINIFNDLTQVGVYQEVAKKTGKSLDEVVKLLTKHGHID